MTGTSPPGPFRCGSTTWSVKAVATPASKALPPRSRIPMPTAVAIQCVVATTPNVPSISGRVVNGSGFVISRSPGKIVRPLDKNPGAGAELFGKMREQHVIALLERIASRTQFLRGRDQRTGVNCIGADEWQAGNR